MQVFYLSLLTPTLGEVGAMLIYIFMFIVEIGYNLFYLDSKKLAD